MRRAKMRLVLAIVLIIVAIGGLVSMGRNAPGKVDVAAKKPVKTAPAKPAVVALKPADVKPLPAPVAGEPGAKPPQAPPDPVYTSFTADPAYIAANAPAIPPTAPEQSAKPEQPAKPVEVMAKPVVAAQPKPAPQVKAAIAAPIAPPVKSEDKIEASPNGTFLLQAGVFSDMENARHQLEKLAAHHIDTHIETKVRIGPFANSDGVEDAKNKVDAAGINITLDELNSSKGTVLQAGLFTDMESAKELQAKLKELGLTSRSETRILIGPFDTKTKADMVRNKVKALNISVVLL
jgi:DedD protein